MASNNPYNPNQAPMLFGPVHPGPNQFHAATITHMNAPPIFAVQNPTAPGGAVRNFSDSTAVESVNGSDDCELDGNDEYAFSPITITINAPVTIKGSNNNLAIDPAVHASTMVNTVMEAIKMVSPGDIGIPMIDEHGRPRPINVTMNGPISIEGEHNNISRFTKGTQSLPLGTGTTLRPNFEEDEPKHIFPEKRGLVGTVLKFPKSSFTENANFHLRTSPPPPPSLGPATSRPVYPLYDGHDLCAPRQPLDTPFARASSNSLGGNGGSSLLARTPLPPDLDSTAPGAMSVRKRSRISSVGATEEAAKRAKVAEDGADTERQAKMQSWEKAPDSRAGDEHDRAQEQ